MFDELSTDSSQQNSSVLVASSSLVNKKTYCMDALLSICTARFSALFDYGLAHPRAERRLLR